MILSTENGPARLNDHEKVLPRTHYAVGIVYISYLSGLHTEGGRRHPFCWIKKLSFLSPQYCGSRLLSNFYLHLNLCSKLEMPSIVNVHFKVTRVNHDGKRNEPYSRLFSLESIDLDRPLSNLTGYLQYIGARFLRFIQDVKKDFIEIKGNEGSTNCTTKPSLVFPGKCELFSYIHGFQYLWTSRLFVFSFSF